MTKPKRKYASYFNVAALMLLSTFVLTTSTGCIGAMAQLMYVIKGHKVAPAYEGLEGKRVAIHCLSEASAYGPDTLTYTVAKHVGVKIQQGVKKVEVVSPGRIEDWIDENGWEDSNIVPLGKHVGADVVIVIEIGSYSIHDGATIYKGRADLSVTVYDVKKDGQVLFSQGPDEYSFPKNGRPAIQNTPRQFESFFLARLTEHISRLFVAYDKMETFADDAMMN